MRIHRRLYPGELSEFEEHRLEGRVEGRSACGVDGEQLPLKVRLDVAGLEAQPTTNVAIADPTLAGEAINEAVPDAEVGGEPVDVPELWECCRTHATPVGG